MNFHKFDSDDRGVSPVIGVILMVAITVILAAVIGTFVLNLGSNVNNSINAGVSFDQTQNTNGTYEVTVQVTDMGNADSVWVTSPNKKESMSSVGATKTFYGLNADDQITVIGNKSGDSTVLQNYEVRS